MLLDSTSVRFHVVRARQAGDDATLVFNMAMAMVSLADNSGAATKGQLTHQFGFTAEECDRLQSRAADEAAVMQHGRKLAA